jgi:hypothetical protein
VTAFVAGGAGFLLAVLWFDLMFDVQMLRAPEPSSAAAESRVASIAGYYARVTTAARPMNRLISVAMLGTLAAIVVELARGDDPRWLGWASLVLVAPPIGLAAAHTFPSAVRLGRRTDSLAAQYSLARSILRDHLFCLAAIATLLGLQLGFGT